MLAIQPSTPPCGPRVLRRAASSCACAALLLTALSPAALPAAPPSLTDAEVNARAAALLARLTMAEKISLMAGASRYSTEAIPRLGIPALNLSDGPNGVRSSDDRPATVFPTGAALGATWDPQIVQAVGAAIGAEARAMHVQLLLAPDINIQRHPLAGRTFESYSEDPLLDGTLGTAYVRGVQSQGVGACVKHFLANNQEANRLYSSSNIGPRAIHEIYLAPFKQVVRDAHPWAVMMAYNKLNGTYMTESPLIHQVLEQQWGFPGLVLSDWGALHSTVPAARAGLDLEMPGPPSFFGAALAAAVRKGQVGAAIIDQAALRVLRTVVRAQELQQQQRRSPGEVRGPHARAVALAAARESITLLKNEHALLPLSLEHLRSLALIGPEADVPLYQGEGSSHVVQGSFTTILTALRTLAPHLTIRDERGVDIDADPPPIDPRLLTPTARRRQIGLGYRYYAGTHFNGRPVRSGVMRDFSELQLAASLGPMSARWEGYLWPKESGLYQLSLTALDKRLPAGLPRPAFSARLFINGRQIIGAHGGSEINNGYGRTARITLRAGQRYRVRVDYVGSFPSYHWLWLGLRLPPPSFAAALKAARDCDAAILVVGSAYDTEREGRDRTSLTLPGGQDALVRAVLAANPRTIVVLESGAPYEMPWVGQAPAILEAWLNGEEGPQALAEVLFGAVNPSGKLPMSFPVRLADTPAYLYYATGPEAPYGEGVFVGYRYYDTRGIAPLFPFGHGLSYTTFAYSDMKAPASIDLDGEGIPEDNEDAEIPVSFTLTNTGARSGTETVQLYVAGPADHDVVRPPKALKAFRRISLAPGESRVVRFTLTLRDLACYDVDGEHPGWDEPAGLYRILIGSSSADIRLQAPMQLAWEP